MVHVMYFVSSFIGTLCMYAFIVTYIPSHSWLHCSLKSTTVIALNKIGPSQYTGLKLQNIITITVVNST